MGEMWTNAEAGGGYNNKNRTKSKRKKKILRFGYEREPHENVERVEKATLHTTNGFVEHFCSSPSIFYLPMYGWIVHMIRLRQKYNAHYMNIHMWMRNSHVFVSVYIFVKSVWWWEWFIFWCALRIYILYWFRTTHEVVNHITHAQADWPLHNTLIFIWTMRINNQWIAPTECMDRAMDKGRK